MCTYLLGSYILGAYKYEPVPFSDVPCKCRGQPAENRKPFWMLKEDDARALMLGECGAG